ncbi:MAG: hypothetical protein E7422_08630 [Ruminococcaceae bacterium]|nr:hypothetical protein [Oscillospiraceae bacterium]
MGVMKCPQCGCTISEFADACPGCGYRQQGRNFYPGKPKSTAIPVRCPWCGEMVPAGRLNCPNCGSPAKVSYSTTPRRLEPVDLDELIPSRRETEKKEKMLPAWLLVLIALLLAAMLFWGIRTIRTLKASAEQAEASAAMAAVQINIQSEGLPK